MNWLHYLLQVNIYLTLFYALYRFWLRNETFHQLNRTYLVASATLSFFIPTLHSEWLRGWFVTQEVSEKLYTYYNPQTVVVTAVQANTPSFTWGHMFALIYVVGVLILIGRLTYQIAHIERFVRRRKGRSRQQVAFSFFNFWQVSPDVPHRQTIIAHEKAHIRQLHSADVLLFELIAIFNWFNPVVFAYKQSIRNIHEFLADQIAARYEASNADYAMLLLSQQLGVRPVALSNNFFDPISLKRRILMLAKPQSSQRALWKYGLVLPMFVAMVVISSAAVSEHQQAKLLSAKIEKKQGSDIYLDLSETLVLSPQLSSNEPLRAESGQLIDPAGKPVVGMQVKLESGTKALTDSEGHFRSQKAVGLSDSIETSTDLEVASMLDKMPEFPGGAVEMYRYLARTVKYPKGAVKSRTKGTVYVTFIVDVNGKIRDIVVPKGIGGGCDEEAMRVVQSMPDWIPGEYQGKKVNAKFTLPINFQLN